MLSLSGRLSVETGYYGDAVKTQALTNELIARVEKDAALTGNFTTKTEKENRELALEYKKDIISIAKVACDIAPDGWWEICGALSDCYIREASPENMCKFLETLKRFN